VPEPEAILKVHAALKEDVTVDNDLKNEFAALRTQQEAS
jgi:hypothetical protein